MKLTKLAILILGLLMSISALAQKESHLKAVEVDSLIIGKIPWETTSNFNIHFNELKPPSTIRILKRYKIDEKSEIGKVLSYIDARSFKNTCGDDSDYRCLITIYQSNGEVLDVPITRRLQICTNGEEKTIKYELLKYIEEL